MIPKIFHQVWINRHAPQLPAEFAAYRDTWLRHHPDWEYRLWNLENLDFRCVRADLLPQCISYSELADLLRFELLYRHGGVYIDTDFECFKPIDGLIAGLQTFACSENGMVISPGLMGSEPGSDILRRLVYGLPETIGDLPPNDETGPGYVTRTILHGGFGSDFALLPSKLFYPYAMGEARVTAANCGEAYAAHHWAHSWADPKQRSLIRRVRNKLFGRPRPQPFDWVRETAAVRAAASAAA